MSKNYGPGNYGQGGFDSLVADPVVPEVYNLSGGSEPSWPTTEYATVVDGGITWTAILARVGKGTVTGDINRVLFQHGMDQYPDHYFQYGTVTWLTGANAGHSCDVRDSLGPTKGVPYIFLLEIASNEIVAGDTFEATVGCSKIRLACQQFNNFDNHRAFPDMPTEDRALSTPDISAQGYAPRTTS